MDLDLTGGDDPRAVVRRLRVVDGPAARLTVRDGDQVGDTLGWLIRIGQGLVEAVRIYHDVPPSVVVNSALQTIDEFRRPSLPLVKDDEVDPDK